MIIEMRDVTQFPVVLENPQVNDFMKTVVELFPEPLASNYLQLETSILEQSEVTIKTLLGNITPQMEAIRTRLWQLVSERMKFKDVSRIQLSEVAHGIAPIKYLEQVFARQYYVAWCGVPTTDYKIRVDALLDKAFHRMNEILDLPIKDDKGKVDTKAAALILQVAKMVDMRSQGNYTERIEQKTLQVNTTAEEARKIFSEEQALSLEEINKKLAQLEGTSAAPISEFIDVKVGDDADG